MTIDKAEPNQFRTIKEIIASLNEAAARAGGENVPARVTTVHVPATDVRALRRSLGVSPSEFAARFRLQPEPGRIWTDICPPPICPA